MKKSYLLLSNRFFSCICPNLFNRFETSVLSKKYYPKHMQLSWFLKVVALKVLWKQFMKFTICQKFGSSNTRCKEWLNYLPKSQFVERHVLPKIYYSMYQYYSNGLNQKIFVAKLTQPYPTSLLGLTLRGLPSAEMSFFDLANSDLANPVFG